MSYIGSLYSKSLCDGRRRLIYRTTVLCISLSIYISYFLMTMKHAAKFLTWTQDFLPGTQGMTDGFLKNIIYHLVGIATCIAAQYIYETSGLSLVPLHFVLLFDRIFQIGMCYCYLSYIRVYITTSIQQHLLTHLQNCEITSP